MLRDIKVYIIIKKNKKWCAQIRINKKLKYLGYFDTAYDAHLAYETAAEKLHGEYRRAV
jgi:hypothetical protein